MTPSQTLACAVYLRELIARIPALDKTEGKVQVDVFKIRQLVREAFAAGCDTVVESSRKSDYDSLDVFNNLFSKKKK